MMEVTGKETSLVTTNVTVRTASLSLLLIQQERGN